MNPIHQTPYFSASSPPSIRAAFAPRSSEESARPLRFGDATPVGGAPNVSFSGEPAKGHSLRYSNVPREGGKVSLSTSLHRRHLDPPRMARGRHAGNFGQGEA